MLSRFLQCCTPCWGPNLATSVQNRYLWQRYRQRRDLMLTMASSEEGMPRDISVAQAKLLWHGTSTTNPRDICTGNDGIDFRLVRGCQQALCVVRFLHNTLLTSSCVVIHRAAPRTNHTRATSQPILCSLFGHAARFMAVAPTSRTMQRTATSLRLLTPLEAVFIDS